MGSEMCIRDRGEIAIQIVREGTWHDLVGNTAPVSAQSPPFTVEENLPVTWSGLTVLCAMLVGVALSVQRRRTRGR